MRARLPLILSVALNLALAWLLWTRFDAPKSAPVAAVAPDVKVVAGVKTNVVVRRQFMSWRQLEAEEYPDYIANLRAISCPEATIRDIIVADVNELYARRRAEEIEIPEQQWWKSEPDYAAWNDVIRRMDALEAERRELLAELLGPDWERAEELDVYALEGRPLDGPVLSQLTAAAKRAVREIEARAFQREADYRARQEALGLPAQAEDLARLRKAMRDELSQTLSPAQLEAYLLRYSETAQAMRREFEGLNLEPEEFRAIFRVRDRIEQQLSLYYSGDEGTAAQRRALEEQRETAVRQALGPERFALLQYQRDPLFREVKTTTERIGAPAETVLPLFEIVQATERERERVRANPALSPEEQAAAIQTLLTEQHRTVREILGDETYQLYRESRGLE